MLIPYLQQEERNLPARNRPDLDGVITFIFSNIITCYKNGQIFNPIVHLSSSFINDLSKDQINDNYELYKSHILYICHDYNHFAWKN